jgi:hypothetical protein
MNVQRDPDTILAAWLEDGPDRLPEATRRAIAVTTRTTHQTRRPIGLPWRFPTMNGMSRIALAAVAVVAVGLGGLLLFNRSPQGGVGGAPSPSPSIAPTPAPSVAPSPSSAAVPAMVTTFTSPKYGYSLRHPIDWTGHPATTFFDPVAPGTDNTAGVFFDAVVPPTELGLLRAGSARIPAGSNAQDWAAVFVTGCDLSCRAGSEAIVIDGQPAMVTNSSEAEAEAQVIVGDRVYLFTLFRGGEVGEPGLPNLRATFDALMATVDLRPEDAVAAPSPRVSPGASPGAKPSPS